MDDFDESQEDEQSQEDEDSTVVEASKPAPDLGELTRELKSTRKENQTLRSRLNEVMVDRFGEEIVGMIPEEVKAWQRRWAFAETLHGKLTPTRESQTEQATEGAAEEPSAEEAERLAAVAKGASLGAGSTAQTYTPEEVQKIGIGDKARALRIIASGQMKSASE